MTWMDCRQPLGNGHRSDEVEMYDQNNESHLINGLLHSERVAILDCGAQYGKCIDRRVRELNVESQILPLNTSAEKLLSDGYK